MRNVIRMLLQKRCYKLFSIIFSEYQVVDYVVIQVTRCMFAQIVTCMNYMQEFVYMSLHERYCYWYNDVNNCYHSNDVICFYLSLFSDLVKICDKLHGKCYSLLFGNHISIRYLLVSVTCIRYIYEKVINVRCFRNMDSLHFISVGRMRITIRYFICMWLIVIS